MAGRSHCDQCGSTLPFLQTIPIVSYLRLKGACRRCGGRIDPLHLIGEAAGMIVLVSAVALPAPRSFMAAALGLLLIAAAAVDAKTRRLPDIMTGGVAILGGGLALAQSWQALAIGAAASGISALCLQALRLWRTARTGEAGLGLGDVKLIAALALWLGVMTPWMVLGAALLGLLAMALTRPADARLSFGPCLAAVGFLLGVGLERGWLRSFS